MKPRKWDQEFANWIPCREVRLHPNKVWHKTALLKFVNLSVNVSLNMIGCFEVVPLSSAPTVIWVRPTLYFFFSDLSWRHCLAHSFCFVSSCLFASDFKQFFLSKVAWANRPISRLGKASFPYRFFFCYLLKQ